MRAIAILFFAAVFAFIAQFARAAECKTVNSELARLDRITKMFKTSASAYLWKSESTGGWTYLYVVFPEAQSQTALVQVFRPNGCWLGFAGESAIAEVSLSPSVIERLSQSELVFETKSPDAPKVRRLPL
jgi:hypothetical protein